ncbi:class F sortase [Kocuria rosea]|uniref:class F sortase n=1 Tax=Kocuria rosea TaxID=1275 RepID=UPI00232C6FA8|nr:class F sortase [Kocuria rosea]
MSAARERRTGLLAGAALTLLLVSGCADTGVAGAQPPATPSSATADPVPSRTAALPSTAPAPAPSASATPSPSATPKTGEEASPVSVRIPATGTDSPLLHLGLRADGGLEVPPGEPGSPAAWYNQSPVPGEPGPAILLGHVNATDGGPGVFAGLRELDPGDTIEVARQDGTTAVFAVQRGEQYSKDNFDTQAVYGDTAGAELRLITCDGYNLFTGQFEDNYVVYAQLLR